MAQPHLYQPHSDLYRIVRHPESDAPRRDSDIVFRHRESDVPAALELIQAERSRAMTIAVIAIVAMIAVAVGFFYLLVTQPTSSVSMADDLTMEAP
jgi:hypothetical protein